MFSNARRSYDLGAKVTESTRDLEANALFKAARMLDDVRRDWDAPDRPERLEAALAYTQKLWTFFQAELTRSTHPLPAELRSWLLSLSVFLDRRVLELRTEPDPQGLDALIRINREVALGLSAKPGDPAPEAEAA
jgi:flagellar protein FlaF